MNLSPACPDYPVAAVLVGDWNLDGRRLVFAVNHTAPGIRFVLR